MASLGQHPSVHWGLLVGGDSTHVTAYRGEVLSEGGHNLVYLIWPAEGMINCW